MNYSSCHSISPMFNCPYAVHSLTQSVINMLYCMLPTYIQYVNTYVCTCQCSGDCGWLLHCMYVYIHTCMFCVGVNCDTTYIRISYCTISVYVRMYVRMSLCSVHVHLLVHHCLLCCPAGLTECELQSMCTSPTHLPLPPLCCVSVLVYVAWSRGGCGGTGLLPGQPLVPTPHLGLWVPGQCEAGAATTHSVGESSQGQASRRRRGNQVQVRCLTSDQQVKGMCVWESMYVRSLVNQTPLIHRPFICNVTDDITVINGRWKGTSGSQD